MMIYSETANFLTLDKANKVKKDFNFDKLTDVVVNNYLHTPARKLGAYSESVVEQPASTVYTEEQVAEKISKEREVFMKKGQKALELARKDFFEEAEQAFELAKEDFISTGEKILKQARKDWEAEYEKKKKGR
jgi:hypothetical protein